MQMRDKKIENSYLYLKDRILAGADEQQIFAKEPAEKPKGKPSK